MNIGAISGVRNLTKISNNLFPKINNQITLGKYKTLEKVEIDTDLTKLKESSFECEPYDPVELRIIRGEQN